MISISLVRRMKSWIQTVTWVCSLIIGLPSVRAQQLLTVEQAMEAVRRFEGDPQLSLKYRGLGWGRGRQYFTVLPPLFWPSYAFSLGEVIPGRPRLYWNVDPYTGQVLTRVDSRVIQQWRQRPKAGKTVKDMIPPDRAFRNALSLVRRWEPDFDPLPYDPYIVAPGYQPYKPGTIFQEYGEYIMLLFKKREESVASAPQPLYSPTDFVRIQMDAETGEVGLYFRAKYPLNVSLEPTISVDEAKGIAVGYMNRPDIGYAQAETATLLLFPNASYPDTTLLCWVVGVAYVSAEEVEPGESSYMLGRLVLIEAHSGTILGHTWYQTETGFFRPSEGDIHRFHSTPRPKDPVFVNVAGHTVGELLCYPPPMLRENRFYVRRTFAWLMGVRVDDTERGYHLSGVQEGFVPFADTIESDGERWLPLEAVAEASSAKVEWDPAGRSLAIWPCYPGPEEGHPSPSGRALQGGSTAPE